jgi:hypothetical protein
LIKHCKFYNYEIFQTAKAIALAEPISQPASAMIIQGDYIAGDKVMGDKSGYKIGTVGNLNTGTVNIKGNQIGIKELSDSDST